MLDDQGDDEQLKLDSIEGETDLFQLVSSLLGVIEQNESDIEGLEHQIMDRKRRLARCEAKVEQIRNLISSLMDTAGLRKLPLPEATIFTSKIKGKWKIIDPTKLGDRYLHYDTVAKPNREAIQQAVDEGQMPDGVTLGNGYTNLNIRRN